MTIQQAQQLIDLGYMVRSSVLSGGLIPGIYRQTSKLEFKALCDAVWGASYGVGSKLDQNGRAEHLAFTPHQEIR